MDIRFATAEEISEWDAHILANPDAGNVFQGKEFAEQKRMGRWTPRYLVIDSLAITVLEKSVPGLGKLWYLPKGPGLTSVVAVGDILAALRKFAYKNGVFVVKIEPEIEKTESAILAFKELELIPVSPIQPNASTVLVDLSPDLDAILAAFNQKGRHALRRAERDGVTVERVEGSDIHCRQFYDLLSATASGSFVIRSYEYYRSFWQRYEAVNQGQLFFAYHEGKLVAGAYAMVFGEKSTYKDGASVRERPVYGASHLLQWHVMQWAKERGSIVHDLCGTPPSDRINDETHPHYGIGRFKTSFNKQVTDYVGAYDVVVRPRQYTLWTKFGERVTKSLWWRTHHESWY
jgi:lipid II:glycine glycyltransferase (peptidoglycan interpeptide bridge formation enzyme)